MKKALVIGGGFAGYAAAHQLALMGGWDITLVEKAPFLGGGVKTLWYGGHPYTFGPRHFLTPNEHLFDFLNKYVPMRRCAEHEFITYVAKDEQFYHYPIHKDDIPRMPDRERIESELKLVNGAVGARNFEEFWVMSVGQSLYEKFADGYSRKMWQIDDNKRLDDFAWSPNGVTIKDGPRAAWDSAISAYPRAPNGYDDYFDISTADAKVCLGTTIEGYDVPNKTVTIAGEKHRYDVIVSTISPDTLMNGVHGELPYVGRDFIPIVLPVEHAFPENVYFVYYAGDEKFTRVVEYNKFTQHKSESTLIGIEIPSMRNKLYPMPFKREIAKPDKYFADMPEGVFSIGRAGTYRYIDIDDIIEQAMTIAENLH